MTSFGDTHVTQDVEVITIISTSPKDTTWMIRTIKCARCGIYFDMDLGSCPKCGWPEEKVGEA